MALLRPWMLLAVAAGGVVAAVAAAADEGPSLDGAWVSQGYGYLLEIEGRTLRVSEITATTCVPAATAERVDGAVPGREATFKTPEGHILFVREGGDADHKRVHSEGSASDVRVDRVRRRPSVCEHPTENTPMENFEVFSRTWAENYISFDLKKTDWDAVVSANRPKITPATTPAELYDVLEGMIRPFGDVHTFLNAPDLKRQFRTLRPGTDRVIGGRPEEFRDRRMPALLAVTERAHLNGPLRAWCNGQIQYGHAGRTTGYLRILSFSGYREGGDFAAGLADLEAALDAIFTDPTLERLVIDVRINFGGADPYGLVIASRLATSEYLAYTKEARSHPVDRDRWTPADESRVAPSSRPGFRGPVVELTGPLTISAGETFTQALMGRAAHVTRIGESTQGVFSDVLARHLPNGWRFGLPNEVYRTPEGTAFDGVGIAPDIAVPVFADEDVAAGRDPGMARALQVLGTE